MLPYLKNIGCKKMNSITLILEDPIPFIKLIGIPDEIY
jgi:hypothetical protein